MLLEGGCGRGQGRASRVLGGRPAERVPCSSVGVSEGPGGELGLWLEADRLVGSGDWKGAAAAPEPPVHRRPVPMSTWGRGSGGTLPARGPGFRPPTRTAALRFGESRQRLPGAAGWLRGCEGVCARTWGVGGRGPRQTPQKQAWPLQAGPRGPRDPSRVGRPRSREGVLVQNTPQAPARWPVWAHGLPAHWLRAALPAEPSGVGRGGI